MENEKIVLAILGGAIAFYLYVGGRQKKTKMVSESHTQGVNPETLEQPIISTNNAQQAPTKVEKGG
jgi:hypothetical protein